MVRRMDIHTRGIYRIMHNRQCPRRGKKKHTNAVDSGDASDSSDDCGCGVYEGERNAAGEKEGYVLRCGTNGVVYEGQWKADWPEGRGTYRYFGGDVLEFEWVADEIGRRYVSLARRQGIRGRV